MAFGASRYIPAGSLGKELASSLYPASLLSSGWHCRCGCRRDPLCWKGLPLELSGVLILLWCIALPRLSISPLPLLAVVCSALLAFSFLLFFCQLFETTLVALLPLGFGLVLPLLFLRLSFRLSLWCWCLSQTRNHAFSEVVHVQPALWGALQYDLRMSEVCQAFFMLMRL